MGPNAESLALADKILAEHPSIKVNRIDLAYTIMWATAAITQGGGNGR